MTAGGGHGGVARRVKFWSNFGQIWSNFDEETHAREHAHEIVKQCTPAPERWAHRALKFLKKSYESVKERKKGACSRGGANGPHLFAAVFVTDLKIIQENAPVRRAAAFPFFRTDLFLQN